MKELIYKFVVKNGKTNVVNNTTLIKDVNLLADGEYELVVKKKKNVRSLALCRYYWAEVVPKVQAGLKNIGEQLNLKQTDEWLLDFFDSITKEQAHSYLKERFIDKDIVDEATGEITKNRITTTNMTNSQFQDYIAQIVQLGAEHLGVQILQPNEQAEIDLNQ